MIPQPKARADDVRAQVQETAEVTELMRLGIQRYQADDFEGAVRIFKMLVRRHARPRGLMEPPVAGPDQPRPAPGSGQGAADYLLRGNGRYAHGAAYIETVAEPRFDIVVREEAMLRREGGRIVDGGYYLLRRRD